MNQNKVVVFVCEHGAAKSIVAAAYFSKLVHERNLRLIATARGIHPDAKLSSRAVAGLREDGLIPTESVPTEVKWKDLESAEWVVSFCPLPEQYRRMARVEFWEGIPPVSDGYERSRDEIVAHLKELLNHL